MQAKFPEQHDNSKPQLLPTSCGDICQVQSPWPGCGKPANEEQRLAATEKLQLIGKGPQPELQRYVDLVSVMYKVQHGLSYLKQHVGHTILCCKGSNVCQLLIQTAAPLWTSSHLLQQQPTCFVCRSMPYTRSNHQDYHVHCSCLACTCAAGSSVQGNVEQHINACCCSCRGSWYCYRCLMRIMLRSSTPAQVRDFRSAFPFQHPCSSESALPCCSFS